MKELPATLLLRPFNFDTLATRVFTLVSLSLRGSWFVRAHDRACEPRPSTPAARHHCRSRAGSLGELFCRNRRGRGMGVAGREI